MNTLINQSEQLVNLISNRVICDLVFDDTRSGVAFDDYFKNPIITMLTDRHQNGINPTLQSFKERYVDKVGGGNVSIINEEVRSFLKPSVNMETISADRLNDSQMTR
jgi:hypothetical protein